MEVFGKKIHFVGIGGVSMGALANICELDGATVTGSDAAIAGHDAANVRADLDFVVINGAIDDENPELVRARELGIRVVDRAELLAEIESRYVNRIAVAGCHGKSTTVAMIAAVLTAGGLNPTVHNGVKDGLRIGGKEFFVTEACEFRRSFLRLNPTVAVVTNVELDHVDCYSDLADIQNAFDQFTSKAAKVIKHDSDDVAVPLAIAGRHNVENAALAVKVGQYCGVPMETIKSALAEFRGIDRRFSTVGRVSSAAIVVDYAHHPTELAATIATATETFGAGKYIIAFQPHTYSRTVGLFQDFVRVLSPANVVLLKTYSAREREIEGGTAWDLANAIGCGYFHSKRTLKSFLCEYAHRTQIRAVILAGAGDINTTFEKSS